MKKIILLLLAVLICLNAGPALAKEPVEFSEEFFTVLQTGDYRAAYLGLFAGSPWLEKNPEALNGVIAQTQTAFRKIGDCVGVELVHNEKFGSSMVRQVYLYKTEANPLVWEIYYYKPHDTWFALNLHFDDQTQTLRRFSPDCGVQQ